MYGYSEFIFVVIFLEFFDEFDLFILLKKIMW